MDISWDDARLFLAIADGGSVSAAARALRIAQPTVSRRLASLEDALGFPLVARTAKGTTLTPQGERMLEPAKKMAEWAAELSRAAEKRDQRPRGIVKVTAPPGVAFDFLASFAAHLKRKAPEITLQVLSSIEYLDLARGEADLALRFKEPTDKNLTVIHSFVDDVLMYASPSYIARLPKKPAPADLAFIGWAPPYDKLSPNPELAALGITPVFYADDFLVQMRACEAGLGIMFLGAWRSRFSRWKIEPVKVPFPLPTTALHLVCAKRALDVARVRLVADALIAETPMRTKKA